MAHCLTTDMTCYAYGAVESYDYMVLRLTATVSIADNHSGDPLSAR